MSSASESSPSPSASWSHAIYDCFPDLREALKIPCLGCFLPPVLMHKNAKGLGSEQLDTWLTCCCGSFGCFLGYWEAIQ